MLVCLFVSSIYSGIKQIFIEPYYVSGPTFSLFFWVAVGFLQGGTEPGSSASPESASTWSGTVYLRTTLGSSLPFLRGAH